MRRPFIVSLGVIGISVIISLHLMSEPASAQNGIIRKGDGGTRTVTLVAAAALVASSGSRRNSST